MKINELKQRLGKLFYDENVYNMILYSMIDNEYLSFLCDINIDDVKYLVSRVYSRELELIEDLKKNKNYETMVKLENYFSIIELITENSKYSSLLIDELKSKYGSEYLNVLEEVDSSNDSDDEIIKRYLFIKEYQEKQNYLGRNVLENLLDEVKNPYSEGYMYYFDKLREKKILNIDELEILYRVYPKNKLVLLIGGKGYGLTCLYALGFKIPLTYVVLTKVNVESKDLEILDKNKKYSVRSSNGVEDGDEYSFAGMFESYLDVSYDGLLDSINKVVASSNSERVKEYLRKNNLKGGNMAVVINEYKEVTKSGVWFGTRENEGIYEYVEGVGEKLVSGEENSVSVNYKEGSRIKLDGLDIGKVFIDIQRKIGHICDLEWCIIDSELVMLQFRSITKKLNVKASVSDVCNDKSVAGLPVSPGKCEGKIIYISDYNDNREIEKGSILLAEKTDVRWIKILEKVSGLITKKGSLLCHAAIIAREQEIPCVTRLSDEDFERLKNAKYVEINGDTGIITIK